MYQNLPPMKLVYIGFVLFIVSTELVAQNFQEMGKFNDKGVPSYLDNTNEIISPTLLTDLSIVLPDGENLAKKNPQLYNRNMSYITLKQSGDVYLAFVSEGADFKSAVGFYTYKTKQPTSSFQISNAKLVFPNVSGSGSGGGLVQGNRVKLGNFPAGTSIGFFLVSNGFQMGRVSPFGNDVFYTDPNLNPEFESGLKKHSVFLYDESSGRFVMMFEDMNRSRGSDHDFNDAVFLISTGTTNLLVTDGSTEIQKEKKSKTGIPAPPVKLTICHYPPGNRENPQSLSIAEEAWPAHQAHGDAKGECPVVTTQQIKPVDVQNDFNVAGDWQLWERDQINTIILTPTGINVKTCNSPRWFSYTRVDANTYRDAQGNMYRFENVGRGGWKSSDGSPVVAISRVPDIFNGSNENDKMDPPAVQTRFTICHYPPGNPNNPQEITIPESAWSTHEAHGDVKGPCGGVQQPNQPEEKKPGEFQESEKKMVICHYPPGNKKNSQQLTIPESAWAAHQKHGDTIGPCK